MIFKMQTQSHACIVILKGKAEYTCVFRGKNVMKAHFLPLFPSRAITVLIITWHLALSGNTLHNLWSYSVFRKILN